MSTTPGSHHTTPPSSGGSGGGGSSRPSPYPSMNGGHSNEFVEAMAENMAGFGRQALAALDVREGEAYLEVACGPGVTAVEAARRGAQVTATDLNAAMIELTKGAYSAAVTAAVTAAGAGAGGGTDGEGGLDSGTGTGTCISTTTSADMATTSDGGCQGEASMGTGVGGGGGDTTVMAARRPEVGLLTATVMDGQALSFPDEAFDCAFTAFGVTLFPDWRKGLTELFRVTKTGGRVGVATWAEPENNFSQFIAEAAVKDFAFEGEISFTAGLAATKTEAGLADAMSSTGFHNVTVQRAARTVVFPSLECFVSGFSSPQMSSKFRGGATHEAFMESVRKYAVARVGTMEGPCLFTVQFLIAVGRKL